MKVLVVDDLSFARSKVCAFLNKIFPDIKIVCAHNGRDGYAAFIREQPDFIFTDLLMPEISGQDMIKRIREIGSNVQIFVLTADIQKTTKFDLIPFDIAAFINKPLDSTSANLIKHKVEEHSNAK
ncbi:MAG: response regulator transcription factor [Negativicutes bacterium]